ncbi:MAG: substrate-binding domain-containing protein [Deltaproteobacteria bacterium]|nr:substrate-binding domain-containing protein [Deltaproteobacteria bacterium]
MPSRASRLLLLLLVLAAVGCPGGGGGGGGQPSIILATTTSTQDSGLLEVLLPRFRHSQGIEVKMVAVGTGEALAMGSRGDADVLLVHAPAKEAEFMARGDGSLRLAVMHNDFVLVGPAEDPAAVKGLDAVEALRRIAARASPFASRGDRSGTHQKELDLWKKAGLEVDKAPWRLVTGQGMGETLRVAAEKRAYTFADRGTYLALRATLDLVLLCEGGAALLNPYAVIVVSPSKFPRVHAREAEAFARWLVGPEAQKSIGELGVAKYGEPLFVPDAHPAPGAGAGAPTEVRP